MIGRSVRCLLNLGAGLAAYGLIGVAVVIGLAAGLLALAAVLLAIVAGLWLIHQLPGLDMVLAAIGALFLGGAVWWWRTTSLASRGRYFGDWLSRSTAIAKGEDT